MPPKIRTLIADLERAGFVDVHPGVKMPVTISGNPGDDAKRYQIRAVREALEEAKK